MTRLRAPFYLIITFLALGAPGMARALDPPPFAFEWTLTVSPGTISIDPNGNLWFLEVQSGAIHRALRDGNPLYSYGSASDLACDDQGSAYVLEGNNISLRHADGVSTCVSSLLAISAPGSQSIATNARGETFATYLDFGPSPEPTVASVSTACVTQALFDPGFQPGDLAVGPDGTLFLVDRDRGRIVHLNSTGSELGSWTLPSDQTPTILAVDPDGNLLATEGESIFKFDASGTLLLSWGDPARFRVISGIAVNALGDIYVCDSASNTIRMFGVRQPNDNPPVPPVPPPPPPPPPPPLTSHPAAVLLHVRPSGDHESCAGPSSLDSVITALSASPDDAHHSIVYMIATPDPHTMQICGVQAGIVYEATRDGHPGLEVLGWHTCSDLEFAGDDWPASGSGNTMTWADNYSTDINVVGYFEVIAHGPSTMSVIPWPNTGMAKIANCSAMEYALEIPPDRLGWVSWGHAAIGTDTDGCNPAFEPCRGGTVPVQPSTWGRLKNLYGH